MYRTAVEKNATLLITKEGVVQVLKAELRATDGGQIRSECETEVRLVLNSPEERMASFYVGISQGTAFPMFVVDHQGTMPEGDFEVCCKLGYLPLPKGHYSLWAAITGFPRGKRIPTCRGSRWSPSRPSAPTGWTPRRGHGALAGLRRARSGRSAEPGPSPEVRRPRGTA